MGLLSWISIALLVFLLLRFVRAGRGGVWLEVVITMVAGVAAGMVATALDFGGWSVLDWRAVAFVALVSVAAVGCRRLSAQLLQRRVADYSK